MKKINPFYIFVVLFSIIYWVYFISSINHFNLNYLRFSTIDFVYKNKLGFSFYILIALQIVIAIFIFFKHNILFRRILDCSIYLHTFILAAYLLVIKTTVKGCVDCNYLFKVFSENINSTLIIHSGLLIVYTLFLREVELYKN